MPKNCSANRATSVSYTHLPLQQTHVDLLLKRQRVADAERALDNLLKTRAKDPDVWYQVAEVRGLSGNTIGLHLSLIHI